MNVQQTGVVTEKVIVAGLWRTVSVSSRGMELKPLMMYRGGDENMKKIGVWKPYIFSQEMELNQLMVCTEENENL